MLGAAYLRTAAPVEATISAGRFVARVECAQCGARDEWVVANKAPPADILAKHFAQKGWNVRKRPICPACNTPQKKETDMNNVAPIKPDAIPTDAVKAARRKANELLMFQFNVENGCFEDGWSDDRVAKESGMPLAWVTKRRDEEYGPLKEPCEFAEVRAEAKALASEIGKLQSKLDAMAKRNGWAN